MTATMTKERAQFYADVLTTAVEGGINYWAAVSEYRWQGLEPEDVHVTVHEQDPDGSYETPRGSYTSAGVKVTVPDIAKAFRRIDDLEPIQYLSEQTRKMMRDGLHENTAGDIDANLADVVIQLVLFGRVVYG